MKLRTALQASPSMGAFYLACKPRDREQRERDHEQANRVLFRVGRALGLIKITPPAKHARR